MQQPEPHHFHLAHLVGPAIDSAVRAVSDRGNQSEAQRVARADDAETLIMSLQPCDGLELMLAGQLVMYNELLADGVRDVLRGMVDTMKQRSLSTLVAAGRLVQGHVDRLEKRGIHPHRTEIAVPQAEPRESRTATPAQARNISPPAVAKPSQPATPAPAPAPQSAPSQRTPIAATAEPPAVAAALANTPRPEVSAQTETELARPALSAHAPVGPSAAKPAITGDLMTSALGTMTSRPALPHQPAGYPPAHAPVGSAAAGN